VNNSLLESAGT